MNDEPRRVLAQLVVTHGRPFAEDGRVCKSLLNDALRNYHRKEVNVLVLAVEAKVVSDLLNLTNTFPPSVLIGRLAQKLSDEKGTGEAEARWAVESWALALGLMTDQQIAALSLQLTSTSLAFTAEAERVNAKITGSPPVGSSAPMPSHSPLAASGSQWFVSISKKKCGPYSWDDLKQLAGSENIQPTTMLLQQGATKWVEAQTVPGFFTKQVKTIPTVGLVTLPARRRKSVGTGGGFRCAKCGSRENPHKISKISTAGWVIMVVMILLCWPLFWIGFLIKEEYEVCGDCGVKVGS
jgi:hypothetical protein